MNSVPVAPASIRYSGLKWFSDTAGGAVSGGSGRDRKELSVSIDRIGVCLMIAVFFLISFLTPAGAENRSEIRALTLLSNGVTIGSQSLRVFPLKGKDFLVFTDRDGSRQEIVFQGRTNILSTLFMTRDGRKRFRADYGLPAGRITVSGEKNYTVAWRGRTYDDSVCMFFLPPRLFAGRRREGERILFNLLPLFMGRAVGMVLRYCGTEEFSSGSLRLKVEKYEMGFAGLLGLWPHKYYYWFAEEDGRFLKYEGSAPGGIVYTTVLKEVHQSEPR